MNASSPLFQYFKWEHMSVNLTGRTKETIIDELLAILVKSNNLKNSEEIRKAIFEREMQLSTGLEKGIAIPHVRTSYVNNIYCAIGITREGVDFQSIDGKPAYVIILSLVPSEKPVLYVQFMSTLMQILAVTNLKKLLSMSTENELYSYLVSEYKSQNEKTD